MNLLSVAGSDPSSGAGIQRDLRTFSALGHRGFSAVTAVTSQNSSGFFGVAPIPPEAVGGQIRSVLEDFEIDAVKVGMVYSSDIIEVVGSALGGMKVPIVLDPVVKSTTGGTLLLDDAVGAYRRVLLPLAAAVTPNVEEAGILSGVRVGSADDASRAAERLVSMGCGAAVVTGVRSEDRVSDHIRAGAYSHTISGEQVDGEVHGSGCVYSAVLTASLAAGASVLDAARSAARYSLESMGSSGGVGRGVSLAGEVSSGMASEMRDAVRSLMGVPGVCDAIPEVQSNLAYARGDPESTLDVLAVQGRIVRSGSAIIQAGPLVFGASRHVASAILEVNRRFPQVRSAINIRLSPDILERVRGAGMAVLSYDRSEEPADIKHAENGSVRWGVRTAIEGAESAPDAIFHRGDYGKEPMMLLFGRTPDDVVRKVGAAVGSERGSGSAQRRGRRGRVDRAPQPA